MSCSAFLERMVGVSQSAEQFQAELMAGTPATCVIALQAMHTVLCSEKSSSSLPCPPEAHQEHEGGPVPGDDSIAIVNRPALAPGNYSSLMVPLARKYAGHIASSKSQSLLCSGSHKMLWAKIVRISVNTIAPTRALWLLDGLPSDERRLGYGSNEDLEI